MTRSEAVALVMDALRYSVRVHAVAQARIGRGPEYDERTDRGDPYKITEAWIDNLVRNAAPGIVEAILGKEED